MVRAFGLLLLLVLTAPAGAEPNPSGGLHWVAPRGCPAVASVRSRIERRLERSLDDVRIAVEVEVSRVRGRYVARVDLGALTVANDVRTLTSQQCAELADGVAVIIARVASERIARDERAAEERIVIPDLVASDAPTSQPAARAQVDRGEPPTSTGYVPRPWTLGVRLSGITGIGVIPQVGLGGELAVTVRAGKHLAELGTARWVASAAQLHDGAPAKVNVDLGVTVARYGWRPAVMPLRAWVAVEVGKMESDSVKLPTDQLASGRWIAAGAGFGIAWQIAPWVRLVGTTETMLAVERVKFSVGDGMVVYAPSPMSVRTSCGLEVGWQ